MSQIQCDIYQFNDRGLGKTVWSLEPLTRLLTKFRRAIDLFLTINNMKHPNFNILPFSVVKI